MKKASVGLLTLAACLLLIFSFSRPPSKKAPLVTTPPTPTTIPAALTNTILFVPYWTVSGGIDQTYNEYIYFGIVPDTTGIMHTDPGYQTLQNFLHKVPSQAKKMLGVQMINNTTNAYILQNDAVQQKVITDAISVAKANGFDGIVLDLEYNAFPFDSVIQSVSTFSKRFADRVKDQKLLFYQTIYGDTYYRGRPYTVKDLAKNADRILVMAYDFHKANGDPGANFPLETGTDDYTFTDMIHNFAKDVPISKLTVIFGMFGYDWTLNEKGNSMGQAESLSDNEILQKFINHCSLKNCQVKTDHSQETMVEYEDSSGYKHQVWFEDKASVSKKETVVKENGISSVGFWANGYF